MMAMTTIQKYWSSSSIFVEYFCKEEVSETLQHSACIIMKVSKTSRGDFFTHRKIPNNSKVTLQMQKCLFQDLI
jgi:hypothetical protein